MDKRWLEAAAEAPEDWAAILKSIVASKTVATLTYKGQLREIPLEAVAEVAQ